MAYGTPRSKDEILPYYTDIRRGRPPTEEQLGDLIRRYEAIGGLSPLAKITDAQRDSLQAALDAINPGAFTVRLGLKHAAPMIEDATQQLIDEGVESIVGLVLAPHYSSYSIGQYLGRVKAIAEPAGVKVSGVDTWATEPAFVEFLTTDLRSKLKNANGKTKVFFTAHSLPQRIIDGGDPYVSELRSTAEVIASNLGLNEGADWDIAWQSAGRTPEPWLGPDILQVIDDVAAQGAYQSVIVSACGFVADHLEVLYDLDIEALNHASSKGLGFSRTACVNTDPNVMNALAARVTQLAGI
jgi:ferrochelatase